MSDTETVFEDRDALGRLGRFIEFFKISLRDFEVSTGLFVEIVRDQDLPLAVRATAVSVLLYIVAVRDIIPDLFGRVKLLGLLDDVLIMTAALSIIVLLMPEDRLEYYREKYTAVAKIYEHVRLLQATLGMLWDRLRQYAQGLKTRKYNKASAEEVVKSPELLEALIDDVMIYVANLNLDPETIGEGIEQLPPPETVIKLLAGGLEEEEDRERKEDSSGESGSRIRRMLPPGDKPA